MYVNIYIYVKRKLNVKILGTVRLLIISIQSKRISSKKIVKSKQVSFIYPRAKIVFAKLSK